MASSIIHIAVANEINKVLKRTSSHILIGSIAPDISKLVGETKKKSHFLTEEGDIPNIEIDGPRFEKISKIELFVENFPNAGTGI